MKDRIGSLQLFLFKDDGSEKYIYQNTRNDRYANPEFNLYNKKSQNHQWIKVYRTSEYRVQWTTDTARMWGEPLNLSSIFTIDETATRPRRGTSDPLPVSISGDWTWEDPFVVNEENTLRVTNVNTTARSVTVDRDILRGVRSHQEEMNRIMQQQAEALLHRNEMERRAAQSQADARRREEERTRQRRPWERARNFFGLD